VHRGRCGTTNTTRSLLPFWEEHEHLKTARNSPLPPSQNGLNKFEFGDGAVEEVAAVCEGSGLRKLSGGCLFDIGMLWRVINSRTDPD
jgi:hypothetical protein